MELDQVCSIAYRHFPSTYRLFTQYPLNVIVFGGSLYFLWVKFKTMNEDQFKTEIRRRWGYERSRKGRRLTGIFFLLIGAILFAKASGVLVPWWLFTWPMILILGGLFSFLRNGFRSPAPFVLLLIGGVFLFDEISLDVSLKPYLWPAVFILIGIFIIFRPKGRRCRNRDWYTQPDDHSAATTDTSTEEWIGTTPDHNDVIDITTVFGGVKKKILSKQFRGGDIVSIMGGTEVDLSQADFKGKVMIDNFTMFGGTKLIVPADWSVQSEVVAIFGGVDDKRPPAMNPDPNKIIFLEGTCLFGGIEIKSF
jgi:predicted membrane protein